MLALALIFPGCTAGEGVARSVAGAGAQAPAERAIVRTASIRVTVGEVAAAVARVEQAVQARGGLVLEASTGEDSRAELRVRVPAGALDGFLDEVAALGDEEERRVTARDVTEEVADLEAALANNRALRERLRKLLARAKSVDEVLQVERELNRIQTEIDQQDGRLKRLRGEVELSAVTVELERRRILGPLGYAIRGAGWLIEKLFVIRD
jgi:hypothetical protein